MSLIWNAAARARVWPRPAVSVLVMPAVAIGASSIAAATVLDTLVPHGLATGDTVAIAGHIGSTPPVDGTRVVSVIDPTHVSVPVAVTVAGAGGTLTRTIAREPFTIEEAKALAGLTWVAGDSREAMLALWLAGARSQVEQDTGLALLAQTRDLFFEAAPDALIWPSQSRPLQAVTWIRSWDQANVATTLDPAQYVVHLERGLLARAPDAVWPTDLRAAQPWAMRIVAGLPAVTQIPPQLLRAVGLLTAHYATLGRDLASLDPVTDVPHGYAEAISPYVPVSLV